jgi:hypothetical protein
MGRLARPRGLSAEDQCVLLLARGASTPMLDARARALLAEPLAWPTVLRQARRHAVAPLLGRSLARLGWPGVPGNVRAELELGDRRNAARNALLARELAELLARCRERGVPAIPLKGVTLAERLYGDPSLRECHDIDVLVPTEAIPKAWELLVAAGYAPAADTSLRSNDAGWLRATMSACAFVRQHREFRYVVDLHWHVAWRWPAEAATLADLWAEARSVPFHGGEAWTLSREWEFLFLAVHAARHRWQPLKWLVDMHELCERGDVDWGKLKAKATTFGLDRVLALTMGACHTLLGTEVPEGLPHEPPPAWLPLFPDPPPVPDVWTDSVFPARLFPRPGQKFGYLARLAFGPTLQDRAVLRLPPALDALYYCVRPVRLAVKLGRTLAGWGAATVRGARRAAAVPS